MKDCTLPVCYQFPLLVVKIRQNGLLNQHDRTSFRQRRKRDIVNLEAVAVGFPAHVSRNLLLGRILHERLVIRFLHAASDGPHRHVAENIMLVEDPGDVGLDVLDLVLDDGGERY